MHGAWAGQQKQPLQGWVSNELAVSALKMKLFDYSRMACCHLRADSMPDEVVWQGLSSVSGTHREARSTPTPVLLTLLRVHVTSLQNDNRVCEPPMTAKPHDYRREVSLLMLFKIICLSKINMKI